MMFHKLKKKINYFYFLQENISPKHVLLTHFSSGLPESELMTVLLCILMAEKLRFNEKLVYMNGKIQAVLREVDAI